MRAGASDIAAWSRWALPTVGQASGQSTLDMLTIALQQASGQRLASSFASNGFHFPDDPSQFPLELDSRLFSQTGKAVPQAHAAG